MAGTFAHMTLVYSLCRDAALLDSMSTLTDKMKSSLMRYINYCELGSVSPDYPYLTVWSSNAAGWANVMHYWKTADFIRSCIPLIYDQKYSSRKAFRCLAWIFGYTAHVVTDMTVHPIVNAKVGPYEQNKTAHRVCEMNQDVYIFKKLGPGEVTSAEYLQNCGLSSCIDSSNNFDPDISWLWTTVLEEIKKKPINMRADLDEPKEDPAPDQWHKNFIKLIGGVAEEGGQIPFISRHLEEKGIFYCDSEDIDYGYIEELKSPDGSSIHYDDVFRQAQENVKKAWAELGSALDKNKPELFTLPNGDLDSGKYNEEYIFWRA